MTVKWPSQWTLWCSVSGFEASRDGVRAIPFTTLAASFTVWDCLRPVSSTSPHRLARARGFVLLRVTASIDMDNVGAFVGWRLRVVGRHVDLFWLFDGDEALPREG